MNLFQLVATVLLIVYLGTTLLKVKGSPALKIVYELRWFLLFTIAYLIIAVPYISVWLAQVFGIQRGADFIIYVSLVWVLFKLKGISADITNLNRKLDSINREIALNKGSGDVSNNKKFRDKNK